MTIVAAAGMGVAWLTGWPPRRLYAAALWCLPMIVTWLVAIAAGMAGLPAGMTGGSAWLRAGAAPYRAWRSMWQLAGRGHLAGRPGAPAVAPGRHGAHHG